MEAIASLGSTSAQNILCILFSLAIGLFLHDIQSKSNSFSS